jgi:hypothetical protein
MMICECEHDKHIKRILAKWNNSQLPLKCYTGLKALKGKPVQQEIVGEAIELESEDFLLSYFLSSNFRCTLCLKKYAVRYKMVKH